MIGCELDIHSWATVGILQPVAYLGYGTLGHIPWVPLEGECVCCECACCMWAMSVHAHHAFLSESESDSSMHILTVFLGVKFLCVLIIPPVFCALCYDSVESLRCANMSLSNQQPM